MSVREHSDQVYTSCSIHAAQLSRLACTVEGRDEHGLTLYAIRTRVLAPCGAGTIKWQMLEKLDRAVPPDAVAGDALTSRVILGSLPTDLSGSVRVASLLEFGPKSRVTCVLQDHQLYSTAACGLIMHRPALPGEPSYLPGHNYRWYNAAIRAKKSTRLTDRIVQVEPGPRPG